MNELQVDGAVPRGRIRSPQRLAAGIALLALCGFVMWAVGDMAQGTMKIMGPAMFPRYLAAALGLFGVVLIVMSLWVRGDPLPRWHLRGPVLITASVVLFSLTVRPFGLVVAGFLSLVVSGLATPEARLREILIFAALMTAACVLLFRYALGMSIPVLIVPGTAIEF